MEAEASYALYVDNSGSVGGSANYWNTVGDIIAKYGANIKEYFLWNSLVYPSNKKAMEN